MAGTLVPVKFKRAWQQYRVGDVITPNGTLRDWLLANGYAERVEQQRPALLTPRAARKVAEGQKRG